MYTKFYSWVFCFICIAYVSSNTAVAVDSIPDEAMLPKVYIETELSRTIKRLKCCRFDPNNELRVYYPELINVYLSITTKYDKEREISRFTKYFHIDKSDLIIYDYDQELSVLNKTGKVFFSVSKVDSHIAVTGPSPTESDNSIIQTDEYYLDKTVKALTAYDQYSPLMELKKCQLSSQDGAVRICISRRGPGFSKWCGTNYGHVEITKSGQLCELYLGWAELEFLATVKVISPSDSYSNFLDFQDPTAKLMVFDGDTIGNIVKAELIYFTFKIGEYNVLIPKYYFGITIPYRPGKYIKGPYYSSLSTLAISYEDFLLIQEKVKSLCVEANTTHQDGGVRTKFADPKLQPAAIVEPSP